ncbi:N-acetyltransferase 9 [Wilcoxina mikolae CBS 423.85]|nr:N-acetyltransferase 9 [Wilcoxina mikolae CBS 423.85]
MLLNASTALLSPKILLVPYEPHHVLTYNSWMQDEEIREATASERLTLGQEYQMQRSWRNDADKLTFILCLPPATTRYLFTNPEATIIAQQDDAPQQMIGDINLFLSEDSDSEHGCGSECIHTGKRRLVGELEVMIARKEYQGQGFGRAAVLLFLWYIVMRKDEVVAAYEGQESVLTHMSVKIHQDNERSIGLFTSLGFKKKLEIPNYFGEFELVLKDLDVVRMFGLLKTYGLEGCKGLPYEYK